MMTASHQHLSHVQVYMARITPEGQYGLESPVLDTQYQPYDLWKNCEMDM